MKHNNIKISPQLTIEQRFAGLLKQNKKKSATIHPQVEDNETILKSTQKILTTLENTGFKYRWYHNIYETKSIKEAKNFLKSIASERPEIIANIADLKEITSRYKFNKIDDKLFFASKYIKSQEKSKQETQVKPKIVTNIEFAEILDTLKINDSEERFSATLEIIDKNNFSYINRENFLNNDFDKIINKNDDIFNFKKLKIAKKLIQNSQKDNKINKIPNFIDFIKNADIDGNKPYFIKECLSELLNINIDQNKNLTISDEDISLLINNIQKNKGDKKSGDKKSIAIQILQRQINYENTIDENNAKDKILKMMKHLNNDSKSLNLSTTNYLYIEEITPIAFSNYRGTARNSMIEATKELLYKEFYNFEQLILKNDKIITINEFSILKNHLPNFNQEKQLINLLSLSTNLISRAKPIEKASNEIIDKIAIKNVDDQQKLKDILKKFLKKDIKDEDIKTLQEIFTANIETGNITKFKNFMIENIDKVCFLLTEDKEEGFIKFNGIISSLKDGCGANISNQLNLVINSLNIQNNDDGKYAEPIRLVTAKIIEEIIIPLTHNSRADILGAGFAASLMQEPFLARYFITPNCLFNKILSIVNYGENIHLIDKDEYSAVKECTTEKATESDDYSNIEILGKKLIAFEIMKEIFKDSEKQNSKFDSLIPNSFELKELQKTIEEANQQKEKENLIKDQEVTPNNNINPSSPIFNRHEKLLAKLQKQNII